MNDHGWLSVDSGVLPKLKEDVLCLLADGEIVVSYRDDLEHCEHRILRKFHGMFDVQISNGPASVVTHWQRLPKLPVGWKRSCK